MKMVCKCIPECFLKLWMFIGGGVHILIGAVLIILALVLDGVDLFPPEMHDEMHSAFMGMLIVGIVIVLSGLFGIIGGFKKIKLLLCCFFIFAFVFFVLTLVIAALMQYAKDYLHDQIGSESACMSFLYGSQGAYDQVTPYWCQKDYCVCKIEDSVANKWKHTSAYTQLKEGGYSPTSNITNIYDCQTQLTQKLTQTGQIMPDWTYLNEYKGFFQGVEKTFHCSGMCKKSNFYVFSNVNNGPPKLYPRNKGCYQDLYKKLDDIFRAIVIPIWIITAFFAGNIVFSCCLLCHKNRKEYIHGTTVEAKHVDVEANYTQQQFLE